MNKKFKNLFFTMFIMMFAIISCGNNSNKSSSSNESNEDVIKIGAIAPLTGSVAQYGIAVIDGVKLKIDEINASGGINGKQIELIVRDSKGDVQETINIFKKLVSQDKIQVFIGEVISSTSLAVAPLAEQAGIPMITASATSLDVTAGRNFVFRTTFTDPYQGVSIAKYASSKGAKSLAILTNSASDYSIGIAKAFKDEAAQLGLNIIEEEYTSDDRDFKAILTKIKNENIDGIVIPDYYNTVGLILSQAKEIGLSTQFYGADGWDGIQTDFSSVAEGAIFSSQFSPEDNSTIVQDFLKKYESANNNQEPSMFNALGYDTATIVEYGLKNATELTGDAIREAMASIQELELVTGKLNFDENRNPLKAITFIEVKDGKLTLKEKF